MDRIKACRTPLRETWPWPRTDRTGRTPLSATRLRTTSRSRTSTLHHRGLRHRRHLWYVPWPLSMSRVLFYRYSTTRTSLRHLSQCRSRLTST